MTPRAFNCDGSVIAPRSDGYSNGLYAWPFCELPARTQALIEMMAKAGMIARYADLPSDLLAALIEHQTEEG